MLTILNDRAPFQPAIARGLAPTSSKSEE